MSGKRFTWRKNDLIMLLSKLSETHDQYRKARKSNQVTTYYGKIGNFVNKQ
jgi:hypothetical protein